MNRDTLYRTLTYNLQIYSCFIQQQYSLLIIPASSNTIYFTRHFVQVDKTLHSQSSNLSPTITEL